jgi:membrane fusion protein, multidrug efflux system
MTNPRKMIVLLTLFCAVAAQAQQGVDAVRVEARIVERTRMLPGELSSSLWVNLYARLNAFVEKVLVDRGSMVKEGQLLLTLSAPELAAQIAEAEAKVRTFESQRAEAEAKSVSSQSTYERLKAASATPGAVAANEVTIARQSVEAAAALVQSLEGSIRAARESAQSLKDLAGYLRITAPFDGEVTTRYVHPGALVGPASGSSGAPMLRLEDNSRLRLVVAVPEPDAGGIVQGLRMSFTVPAYPNEVFSGVVARMAHSLDARTRTMPVELEVQNSNLRLAPGMYAQVQWLVRYPRTSLLVPPASVVTTNERQFVIRVEKGVAEWVTVTRGEAVGDLVEVFGALRPGETVVRRGTDELRPGARVALNVR